MHKYHFDWVIHNIIIRWSLSLKSCPKIRMYIPEERRGLIFFLYVHILCGIVVQSQFQMPNKLSLCKAKTQREWLTCPLLQMWGLIWPHYIWLGSFSMLFGLPEWVNSNSKSADMYFFFFLNSLCWLHI